MKPVYREVLLAAVLGLVLPAVVLDIAVKLSEDEPVASITPEASAEETVTEGEIEERRSLPMLLRMEDGAVVEMDMDEYLTGVILAELPASFEQEAKKAQAVVARTFTRKAWTTGGKHGDGSVCTDSSCCQAYISPEEYRAGGGTEEAVAAAQAAVLATSGYVLTYEGNLIEATYFSCSGGSTEDAVAVWGTDYPYLRATDSPGEEGATHYTDTVTFTKEEFALALGISLSGGPESWLGFTTYTAGGGVNTMCIGGKEFKGTELRKLLGLRSTAFTITADSESVTVVTRGYGHRVGMSQYGADAMAASGSGYEEILAYYYRGTMLGRCEPEEN